MNTLLATVKFYCPLLFGVLGVIMSLPSLVLYPDSQPLTQSAMQGEWVEFGLSSANLFFLLASILFFPLMVWDIRSKLSRVELYLFTAAIGFWIVLVMPLILTRTGFVSSPWLTILTDLGWTMFLISMFTLILFNPLKWLSSRLLE